MTLAAGGRHELLDRAGAGGQGEVWRARDVQHDRIVALKLRPISPDDDRETILREARVLLDLKPHPSLPLVREDFFAEDTYVVVMDWIEGRTLADAVARGGPMTLERALPYLRQIAAALDHLHANDPPIVHQDVKPANVIVRSDGDVVLVDLGISAGGRAAPTTAGTPAFRAPEVASSPPTIAADVYGLAALALTLLSGAPPRPGPRPVLPGVPATQVERIWRALESGLSYDPGRRPVSASDLVSALEPPASAGNVPVQRSVFIGRERDIAEVTELLGDSRVVALVGGGGVGKTRLAYEVAARMAPAYADGVWHVPLAPLRDPSLVSSEVASVLGLSERRGRTAMETLRAELAGKRLLLVLDNCEHVLEGCTPFVDEIAELDGLDILATSRQGIGARGEAPYEVRPLAVPADDAASVKSVVATDAVRLFAERAVRANANFRVTDENAPHIARICRRLDGMPLAIELAASRAGRIPLEEIAQRLDDRFAMLTAEPGTESRQTLRGAFEWSYSLLSERERDVFAAASLFAGGFDDASIGMIAGTTDIADVVASLASKSLLDPQAHGLRFTMLETVRAFARSKLTDEGVVDAFVRWGFDLAKRAADHFDSPDRTMWLERVEYEHDNLRSALGIAMFENDTRALPFAVNLCPFWDVRGHWSEGRRTLAAILDTPDGRDALRADATSGAGRFAYLEADYEVARVLHGEELRIRLALGDRRGEARALSHLGMVAEARGDFESARELYGRSLAAHREVGDDRGIAEQLSNLGNVAEYNADYELAQALHEQSLARRREIGDDQGAASSLLNLGYVMNYRGDARGREVLEESLETFMKVGDRYGASRAMNLLAIRSWFEGDAAKARSFGEDALRLRRDIGDRLGIAVSLESLGGLGAFQGHGAYAALLFGAADRLREVIGSPITPSDGPLLAWATSDAKRTVGEETFDESFARGRTLPLNDAIDHALNNAKTLAR